MNIGLIAHDSKKILMQNFCIAYRGILCKHDIYATATTGRLVEEVTNLNIHKYLAGHLGGEFYVLALFSMLSLVSCSDWTPKSHEPEVTTLFQLCDVHNIPLATNVATAELLVKALERGDLDWRELVRQ